MFHVKEKCLNDMTEMVREFCKKAIRECGSLYQFDGEEAIRRLNLDDMEGKEDKKRVESPKSLVFPLPYSGEWNEECCDGLKWNDGLYTQCIVLKKEGKNYCKGCQGQADKNENGKPDYGTIQDRMAVGVMDYRDAKGRSPVHYSKIMKKRNLSKEQVMEEAFKRNKKIAEIHWEEPSVEGKRGRPKTEELQKEESKGEEEKKKKGRPRKSKKVVEVSGETTHDLFAELIASAVAESSVSPVVEVPVVEAPVAEVSLLVTEKKSEKEAKEAEKKAAKEAKEAEKKAAKEAKEAEKKAAKEAKEAEKKTKKVMKKEVIPVEIPVPVPVPVPVSEGEEEEKPDIVKKFEYEGVQYLKSKKTGIIYNKDHEVVGKWNEETQKIDLQEEEEEEEYEEEE